MHFSRVTSYNSCICLSLHHSTWKRRHLLRKSSLFSFLHYRFFSRQGITPQPSPTPSKECSVFSNVRVCQLSIKSRAVAISHHMTAIVTASPFTFPILSNSLQFSPIIHRLLPMHQSPHTPVACRTLLHGRVVSHRKHGLGHQSHEKHTKRHISDGLCRGVCERRGGGTQRRGRPRVDLSME